MEPGALPVFCQGTFSGEWMRTVTRDGCLARGVNIYTSPALREFRRDVSQRYVLYRLICRPLPASSCCHTVIVQEPFYKILLLKRDSWRQSNCKERKRRLCMPIAFLQSGSARLLRARGPTLVQCGQYVDKLWMNKANRGPCSSGGGADPN